MEWQGKSSLGPYADFMLETDAAIGRVLAAIDEAGIADNTLVILTSDNGNADYAGGKELEAKGHFVSGPLRGYKADAWEGGHRIPFIVRWPGKVAPGTVCDQLVHQTDIFATCAEIVGHELPADAGEDSISLLPLFSDPTKPVRQHAISHSVYGLPALRRGPWKMIFGPGSGGWTKGEDEHPAQLYNLADDLGYMDVGFNNPDTFYDTPVLNKLAAESMKFTQAYAASPVCSPTRASIMTGRYPARSRNTDYSGGANGRGFDINIGGVRGGGPGKGGYFSPYNNPNLKDGPVGEHLPDRLATEVAKFITANKDKPFFVYLPFYSVHTPLEGEYNWPVIGGFAGFNISLVEGVFRHQGAAVMEQQSGLRHRHLQRTAEKISDVRHGRARDRRHVQHHDSGVEGAYRTMEAGDLHEGLWQAGLFRHHPFKIYQRGWQIVLALLLGQLRREQK